MANFNIAIDNVFSPENEGSEYSNRPNDLGRETKYGISKRSYPSVNIENLTESEASAIWFRDFWIPNRLGEIVNQELANKLLNMIGNSGASVTIQQFQTAIKICGPYVGVDGVMGTATINAANTCTPMYLLAVFKLQRISYYIELVSRRSDQLSNLKGWVARAIL